MPNAAAVPSARTSAIAILSPLGPTPRDRRDERPGRGRWSAGGGADGRRDEVLRDGRRRQRRDREGEAATGQTAMEQSSCLGQPAAYRALGASQVIGGLVAGHPVEVAEDDGEAEPIGESLDFLVQHRSEVIMNGRFRDTRRARILLEAPASGGVGPRLDCGPVSHPVQPGSERVPPADRPGIAEQQHERRLERVVGGAGSLNTARQVFSTRAP